MPRYRWRPSSWFVPLHLTTRLLPPSVGESVMCQPTLSTLCRLAAASAKSTKFLVSLACGCAGFLLHMLHVGVAIQNQRCQTMALSYYCRTHSLHRVGSRHEVVLRGRNTEGLETALFDGQRHIFASLHTKLGQAYIVRDCFGAENAPSKAYCTLPPVGRM